MNTNIYSVNFLVGSANLYNFENFLKWSPHVRGYWNYIPLFYCFKCDYDLATVTKMLEEFFPGGSYIVSKIDPYQINGRMPHGAWDWFYAEPENRLKTFATSALPTLK